MQANTFRVGEQAGKDNTKPAFRDESCGMTSDDPLNAATGGSAATGPVARGRTPCYSVPSSLGNAGVIFN
jgi:hypothetical protein